MSDNTIFSQVSYDIKEGFTSMSKKKISSIMDFARDLTLVSLKINSPRKSRFFPEEEHDELGNEDELITSGIHSDLSINLDHTAFLRSAACIDHYISANLGYTEINEKSNKSDPLEKETEECDQCDSYEGDFDVPVSLALKVVEDCNDEEWNLLPRPISRSSRSSSSDSTTSLLDEELLKIKEETRTSSFSQLGQLEEVFEFSKKDAEELNISPAYSNDDDTSDVSSTCDLVDEDSDVPKVNGFEMYNWNDHGELRDLTGFYSPRSISVDGYNQSQGTDSRNGSRNTNLFRLNSI